MFLRRWLNRRRRKIFRYFDGKRQRAIDPIEVMEEIARDDQFRPGIHAMRAFAAKPAARIRYPTRGQSNLARRFARRQSTGHVRFELISLTPPRRFPCLLALLECLEWNAEVSTST